MLVNMQTKKISLNKCGINENVSTWVEQDIIVPDTKPDAMKVINVIVTPYVNNFETLDGKIKIVGKINYFIIYKVDDEIFTSRGLFMSYPYTEVISVNNVDNMTNIVITPNCKNVIFSLPNERKIAIKSEIVFNVLGNKKVDINVIESFDEESNIECKMCEKSFCNILQNKSSIIASKEDIMLPKEAEDFFEILSLDTKISNTEYKESYNKIMVKGDILIKIIYLSENKEEQVKTMNLKTPFSAMIEFENINDRSKFDIKYVMQDFDIRINPDITSSKTMTVNYQICANVSMFEEDEVRYVEDFYSKQKELDYTEETVEAVSRNVLFTKTFDVRENISNVLPPNTKIIDYNLDTSYIIPVVTGKTVELSGNAKINLLLQDNETGELSSKTIDVLINEKYDIEQMSDEDKAFVNVSLDSINVSQSGTDVEIKMVLEINTNVENMVKLNIIEKIEDAILDLSNIDSINVYVVKPKDSLWKIAKKYKTSIDKIVKINEIPNPDVIDVGQKLLIIR